MSSKKINFNLNYNLGFNVGLERISDVNFRVSTTQPNTPADGNCMFHALADQSVFLNAEDARAKIVSRIPRQYGGRPRYFLDQ